MKTKTDLTFHRYLFSIVGAVVGIHRLAHQDELTGMALLLIAVLICPAWDSK